MQLSDNVDKITNKKNPKNNLQNRRPHTGRSSGLGGQPCIWGTKKVIL